MYITSGENIRTVTLIAGSGGILAGDLGVINSGKVVKAAAGIDAGVTVVGVALNTALENGLVTIALLQDNLVRAKYAGTTKTSLANTDLGTVFDLTNANTVNLDDTVGGICVCVGFDNATKEIIFMIPTANRYL